MSNQKHFILRLKNPYPGVKRVKLLALIDAETITEAVDQLKKATGLKQITDNDVTVLSEAKIGE